MTNKNRGARNPYAYAEMLHKKHIDWSRVEDHRSKLEEILGMKYERLFDPDQSFLHSQIVKDETSPPIPEEQKCKDDFKRNHDQEISEDILKNIEYRQMGVIFDDNDRLDGVIQGTINDCFLIASISAIQAADPKYFKERLMVQTDPLKGTTYRIKIIEPDQHGGVLFNETISGKMCWLKKCYDPMNEGEGPFPRIPENEPEEYHVPLYARSKNPNETWCSMIEKAFFLMRESRTNPSRCRTSPRYFVDGANTAKYAMQSLLRIPDNGLVINVNEEEFRIIVTEWRIERGGITDPQSFDRTVSLSTFLRTVCGEEGLLAKRRAQVFKPFHWIPDLPNYPGPDGARVPPDLWGEIPPRYDKDMDLIVEYNPGDKVSVYYSTGLVQGIKEIEIEVNSWTVARPVVANTKEKLPVEINASPNLVAQHSYAVLGYLSMKRSDKENGSDYIVLRNPWGHTDAKAAVYGGRWVAIGPDKHWHLSLPSDDGIFALEFETFLNCFEEFIAPNVNLSVIEDNVQK